MKKTNLSDYDPSSMPDGSQFEIAVIAAEWNSEITNPMLEGAVHTLLRHGVSPERLHVYHVPGTYELTTAAQMAFTYHPALSAAICIGCVVQGETRHFEFICQAVSQGLTNLALEVHRPVIFSVLTTDNMAQAKARSGGEHGNKGIEGAQTALKMCALQQQMQHGGSHIIQHSTTEAKV